jgi:hypothetical protein
MRDRQRTPPDGGVLFVRSALGALLRVEVSPQVDIMANEAKRNCMRATECGKETWSMSDEPNDGHGRNPDLQAGVPTFAPPCRVGFQTGVGFTIMNSFLDVFLVFVFEQRFSK